MAEKSQVPVEIVIAIFDGADRAAQVLDTLQTRQSQLVPLQDNAIVVTVDPSGKVSASNPTRRHGSTGTGALAGLLVGALVGLPIAGVALGGVIGRYRGGRVAKKNLDQMTEGISLQDLLDSIPSDSSLILMEVQDWQAEQVADVLEMHGASTVVHATPGQLTSVLPPGSEVDSDQRA